MVVVAELGWGWGWGGGSIAGTELGWGDPAVSLLGQGRGGDTTASPPGHRPRRHSGPAL